MGTADAVVRRRGLVLVCWAGALALLAPHAIGVERVLETAARVDGSESARVEAELASRFRAPFAQYALLVVRGGASPVTPAGRELVDSVVGAVAAVPGVAGVRGYRDARDPLLLGRDSSGTFVPRGARGYPRPGTRGRCDRAIRGSHDPSFGPDGGGGLHGAARRSARRAAVGSGGWAARDRVRNGRRGYAAPRAARLAWPADRVGRGPAVARSPPGGRAVARVGTVGDEAPGGSADRGGCAARPAGGAGDAPRDRAAAR